MIVKVKYQHVRVAAINQDDTIEEVSFTMEYAASKRKIQNVASAVLKSRGYDASNGFVIRSIEPVIERRSIDLGTLLENSNPVDVEG